ncbi:MAG: radical SAM protein [Candidatus Bathyarchaeia archaeon]
MAKPSASEIWNMNEEQLSRLLESGTLSPKPRRVCFFTPSFVHYKAGSHCSSLAQFPTVSVTGDNCALNCRHCQGKVLQTMHPAQTPEKLLEVCRDLKQKGASGVLVSGGCTPSGAVPIEKFTPAIARIKRDLGLTVFVHTGIISAAAARDLKAAGVDVALIDVIGSDETIREICDLAVSVGDYAESLKAMGNAGLDFVPHVITGLHHGELKGEFEALNMIARHKPEAVVVIAFMPIHGTAMEKTKPPTPLAIAKVTAVARTMFPATPLVLGCMRPKGRHRAETDVLALKAGADGIAFPSEEAIGYAEKQGFGVKFSPFCCAQIYKDLNVQ